MSPDNTNKVAHFDVLQFCPILASITLISFILSMLDRHTLICSMLLKDCTWLCGTEAHQGRCSHRYSPQNVKLEDCGERRRTVERGGGPWREVENRGERQRTLNRPVRIRAELHSRNWKENQTFFF